MSMETDLRAKSNEARLKKLVGWTGSKLEDPDLTLTGMDSRLQELEEKVGAVTKPQEVKKAPETFSKDELTPVLVKMAEEIKKLQGMIHNLRPRSRKYTKVPQRATKANKKIAEAKKAAEAKAKAEKSAA